MRVVWIVGGTEDVRRQFEKQFASSRFGGTYLVRRCDELEEIPVEHLAHRGVVICVDAFHPELGGFEGARRLRSEGFEGSLFIFGEPAPESAPVMWEELNITGFLPPFERPDVAFACGLIHYQLNFEGSIDVAFFLGSTGRAASETIRSVPEMNAFATKLASFVGRFGLDLQQLKKVMMGLTLPHIKVGERGPTVDPPFTVVYGLDPDKLVIGVSSYSRGASKSAFRHEMVAALSNLQQARAPVSSILPEIHHVLRATENVIVYAGHAKVESDSTDPLFVLTTLKFGDKESRAEVRDYHATLAFVGPTPEMSEDEARLEATAARPPMRSAAAYPAPAIEEMPTEEFGEAEEDPLDTGTLDPLDLEKILAEPKLLGDAPVEEVLRPKTPRPAVPPASELSMGVVEEASLSADGRSESELLREIARLKELSKAMTFDVKRLLRERREPSTDKELRESYRDLEEKHRKVVKDRTDLQAKLEEKDKQIDLLKAQVEALRRSAA